MFTTDDPYAYVGDDARLTMAIIIGVALLYFHLLMAAAVGVWIGAKLKKPVQAGLLSAGPMLTYVVAVFIAIMLEQVLRFMQPFGVMEFVFMPIIILLPTIARELAEGRAHRFV
jgi:hypothetical protein